MNTIKKTSPFFYLKEKFAGAFISSKKVYIIPTINGLFYFLTISTQIAISFYYNNNITLILGLLLLIIGVMTAIITNFHIHDIDISKIEIPILEQGVATNAQIYLDNEYQDKYFSIRFQKESRQLSISSKKIKVLPESRPNRILNCKIVPLARSVNIFSHLRIESTFPFGFFYAWKTIPMQGQVYTIPSPISTKIKNPQTTSLKLSKKLQQSMSEFYSHSKIDINKETSKIDWKLFAKTDQYFKKNYKTDQEKQKHVTIDLSLSVLSEDDLKVITSQVKRLFHYKIPWKLISNNKTYASSYQKHHLNQTYKVIASYQINGDHEGTI